MQLIIAVTTTIARTRPNPRLTSRSFFNRVCNEKNADIASGVGRVCLKALVV